MKAFCACSLRRTLIATERPSLEGFPPSLTGAGKNAILELTRRFGVDFPVEVMQQRRYRPSAFVLTEFSGVGDNTRLHRQGVLAKIFRLDELA